MPITCDIRLDGAASWSRAPGPARLMLRCDAPYDAAQLLDNRGIARAMGRTDGATKVLIHRAIKQLEEIISARGGVS